MAGLKIIYIFDIEMHNSSGSNNNIIQKKEYRLHIGNSTTIANMIIAYAIAQRKSSVRLCVWVPWGVHTNNTTRSIRDRAFQLLKRIVNKSVRMPLIKKTDEQPIHHIDKIINYKRNIIAGACNMGRYTRENRLAWS